MFLLVLFSGCAVFTEEKSANYISNKQYITSNKNISVKIKSKMKDDLFNESSLSLTDEILNFEAHDENCIPVENNGIISGSNNKTNSILKNPYLARVLCESIISIKKYNKKSKINFLKEEDSIRNGDLLLVLNWDIDSKPTATNLTWRSLSYLSLTVIPFRGEREYRLTATLSDFQGLLKTYTFHETMIDWNHILLLPAAPFVNGYRKTTEEIHENLIASLLNKLIEEKIL